MEEKEMKKTYWVKKNPNNNTDWIEMDGKQFFDFIKSAAGKGRCFADFGDYKLEVTREQYRKWQQDADHHRYLQSFEEDVLVLSLECLTAEDYKSFDSLLVDFSVNIEDEIIKKIDMQLLAAAVRSLPDDEKRLIGELIMQDKPKTEQELSALTGIPQQTINYRKKKILKKIKNYLVKVKKSSQ